MGVKITSEDGMVRGEVERMPHPASHFETDHIKVIPADNGGFTVEHHNKLKQKFKDHPHFAHHSQWDMKPETHVFTDAKTAHAKLGSMMAVKKAASGPAVDDEAGD